MGGYINGRARVGDTPSAAASGTSGAPDKSQVRFLSSDVGAPTNPPLPIAPPSAPGEIGIAEALVGANPLLLWNLVPLDEVGKERTDIETDFAWRWQKNPPNPDPALGGSPYMFSELAGLKVEQAPIPSGGGSYIGVPKPWVYVGPGAQVVIDPNNTPIWTLAVEFDTSPVTVDGTPPPASSTATSPPFVRMSPSPIVGNSYTNGPWLLYVQYAYNWVGSAGAWTLVLSPRLVLSFGGSGGTTQVVQINGQYQGKAYVEFDNTAKTILLYGGTTTGAPPPAGSHGDHISTGSSGPGGWPGDLNGYRHVFAASNMGPYYWSSWRQLNGHLMSAAIVAESAVDTVALVSERSFVPGTGPVAPKATFRADVKPSAPLPSELGDYTHYFPLDDPSPGPMYDLLARSYLTVVNPTLDTFQTDGISNPLSPTHTKALRLGRTTSSSSYLQVSNASPRVSLGTGAAGDDLTIGCWIRWEGPPAQTKNQQRSIITSGAVPFGFGQETALSVTIYPYAEPFGVQFQTWDHVSNTFYTLKTSGFDWPAEYVVVSEGASLPLTRPYPIKQPVWAYLAVVLRTVSGHHQMEIWMDGVLVAVQAGSDNGWSTSAVGLSTVGQGIQPATLQHLTVWPFALSDAALEGVAG